jgi:hypothetical protein
VNKGVGIFLVGLGILVGYVSVKGLWPQVMLALFYPEDLSFPGQPAQPAPAGSAPKKVLT